MDERLAQRRRLEAEERRLERIERRAEQATWDIRSQRGRLLLEGMYARFTKAKPSKASIPGEERRDVPLSYEDLVFLAGELQVLREWRGWK
jgi:hypothetical protein